MIVGVGTDIVSVERLGVALKRTPGLLDRLFSPGEREVAAVERLAARFAAKEATVKALGLRWAGGWHDVEVVLAEDGRPSLSVTGTVAEVAAARGVRHWHVSLAHDGGSATAIVVAEGESTG
jgi:holo-[acyl-carrier protein] synthase